MTTSLVNSIIQHTTDAEFRAWAKQLSDQLKAVGLVKTADSGQIDFTTALRPAANGQAGYEVFRFADADPLQATRPIFLRISYGTASTTNAPAIWVQFGSGTNGAGTITNPMFGGSVLGGQIARNSAPITGAAPSYVCYLPAEGYLGVVFGSTASTTPTALIAFTLERPKDDAGALVDEGTSFTYLQTTQNNHFFWSQLLAAQFGTTGPVPAFVPQLATASAVGADITLFRHYVMTPRLRNVAGSLTYFDAEIGKGAPFSLPVLGKTRQYLPMGQVMGGFDAGRASALCQAMLWE